MTRIASDLRRPSRGQGRRRRAGRSLSCSQWIRGRCLWDRERCTSSDLPVSARSYSVFLTSRTWKLVVCGLVWSVVWCLLCRVLPSFFVLLPSFFVILPSFLVLLPSFFVLRSSLFQYRCTNGLSIPRQETSHDPSRWKARSSDILEPLDFVTRRNGWDTRTLVSGGRAEPFLGHDEIFRYWFRRGCQRGDEWSRRADDPGAVERGAKEQPGAGAGTSEWLAGWPAGRPAGCVVVLGDRSLASSRLALAGSVRIGAVGPTGE